MPPNQENSTGPVIATVIILAVIILGGLYFWGARSNMNDGVENTAAITTQSTADDTTSIEGDLNETNVDNLDAELNAS